MPKSPLDVYAPHWVELHFAVRKNADGKDRLSIVVFDREDGIRDADGFIFSPCLWFDGKGRVHTTDDVKFRSFRSKGRIGKMFMPGGRETKTRECPAAEQAIHMIKKHAMMWSVYSIVGYELSKVPIVDNKESLKISTADKTFIEFINWLRTWMNESFFEYKPDEAGAIRLNGSADISDDNRGMLHAEYFTEAVYHGFHKVVEKAPKDLFSVDDPEVIGKGAWDGGIQPEDIIEKQAKLLEKMKHRLDRYDGY